MIRHASPDFVRESRLGLDRGAFLMTHRAQSAAPREFSQLSEQAIEAAQSIASALDTDPPVLRRAPDRCVIQIGQIALTLGHLRSVGDSHVGGQLLAIVWHGIIAPRGDHVPERAPRHAPPPPEPIWEEAHVVSAENESGWYWHPYGLEREGFTSTETADRCIDQLRLALEKVPPPPRTEPAARPSARRR
ncbi:MAG TPA: hypothetical protein VGE27_00800 [Gemmatimonas sp.]|uniref:hypothetical protein n=1 Tax=Gemmatimonas sp. TaxID=1962908 RepID=UPI002EDAFF2A